MYFLMQKFGLEQKLSTILVFLSFRKKSPIVARFDWRLCHRKIAKISENLSENLSENFLKIFHKEIWIPYPTVTRMVPGSNPVTNEISKFPD